MVGGRTRRSGRAALAVGAVVVVAIATHAGDGDAGKDPHKRRRGKVVRVERDNGKAGIVRMCSAPQQDGQVACYGRGAGVGEVAYVLDETGRRAIVEVRQVTEQPDNCGNTYSWTLATTVSSGTLDRVSWNSLVVFDWKTTSSSRMIINNGQIAAPGGRVGEQVMSAVDDNGDDIPDLIATYFQCDASGNPAAYVPGAGAYCIAYYERAGASYQELRVDVVKTCY